MCFYAITASLHLYLTLSSANDRSWSVVLRVKASDHCHEVTCWHNILEYL